MPTLITNILDHNRGVIMCKALPQGKAPAVGVQADLLKAFQNSDRTLSFDTTMYQAPPKKGGMTNTWNIRRVSFPESKMSPEGKKFYLKPKEFSAYLDEQGKLLKSELEKLSISDYLNSWPLPNSMWVDAPASVRLVGIPLQDYETAKYNLALCRALESDATARKELGGNVFGSWIPEGTDPDTLTLAALFMWLYDNNKNSNLLSEVFNSPASKMLDCDLNSYTAHSNTLRNLEVLHAEYPNVFHLACLQQRMVLAGTKEEKVKNAQTYYSTALNMLMSRVGAVYTDILVGVLVPYRTAWRAVANILATGTPDVAKATQWALDAIRQGME